MVGSDPRTDERPDERPRRSVAPGIVHEFSLLILVIAARNSLPGRARPCYRNRWHSPKDAVHNLAVPASRQGSPYPNTPHFTASLDVTPSNEYTYGRNRPILDRTGFGVARVLGGARPLAGGTGRRIPAPRDTAGRGISRARARGRLPGVACLAPSSRVQERLVRSAGVPADLDCRGLLHRPLPRRRGRGRSLDSAGALRARLRNGRIARFVRRLARNRRGRGPHVAGGVLDGLSARGPQALDLVVRTRRGRGGCRSGARRRRVRDVRSRGGDRRGGGPNGRERAD